MFFFEEKSPFVWALSQISVCAWSAQICCAGSLVPSITAAACRCIAGCNMTAAILGPDAAPPPFGGVAVQQWWLVTNVCCTPCQCAHQQPHTRPTQSCHTHASPPPVALPNRQQTLLLVVCHAQVQTDTRPVPCTGTDRHASRWLPPETKGVLSYRKAATRPLTACSFSHSSSLSVCCK